MKCSNCNQNLPLDSVFCQYCGSKDIMNDVESGYNVPLGPKDTISINDFEKNNDIKSESVFEYPFRFVRDDKKQTVWGSIILLIIFAMVVFVIQIGVAYFYGLWISAHENVLLHNISRNEYETNLIRSSFDILFNDPTFGLPIAGVLYLVIMRFTRMPLWINVSMLVLSGCVTYWFGIYPGLIVLSFTTLIRCKNLSKTSGNRTIRFSVNPVVFLGISIMVSSVVIAYAIIVAK